MSSVEALNLKLLFFAPFERVIISIDNQASLIGLIESMTVATKTPLPGNAILPRPFTAIALWQRLEASSDGLHKDRVRLFSVDEKQIAEVEANYTVDKQHLNYRNSFNFPGIPVGKSGKVILQLEHQLPGQSDWKTVETYPIQIAHATAKKSENIPKP